MTIVSEFQIWNQIDEAERYLVRGVFEVAASLASSTIHTIRSSKFENPLGDTELADMMNAAGMVIVQSQKELGRTKQVLVELKEIYGSIWAIPVQVFLTGASLQVAEGLGLELRGEMEEYLSKWEYMMDAGVYVLREDETDKSSSNPLHDDDDDEHIRRYFLSCAFYLEVAELYTVKLLAMFLHNPDLAISWLQTADLPQDGRQALLRRLHSLQATQKQAAQRATPYVSTPTSNEDSHEAGNEQPVASKGDKERQDFFIQQSIQRGSGCLHPFLWWFRSIKIKIGKVQFVIPSGKMMLLISLVFWMSFLLRKRGDVFRSMARNQINSLKQAAFDALRLAFSVQMNPLAAVQQVPALPRASR